MGYMHLHMHVAFTWSVNCTYLVTFCNWLYFYTLKLQTCTVLLSSCYQWYSRVWLIELATWLRCVLCVCVCVRMGYVHLAFTCSMTVGPFLAPISTPYVFEAPNFYSTFVFMLPVILQSLVDWQHGWGVFYSMCVRMGYCIYSFTCSVNCDSLELVDWRHGWGVFCVYFRFH